MTNVIIPPSVSPVQVDDFPEGCERSVKGSLHLRPGSKELTAGEWDHLKAKHPKLAAQFQVLPEPAKPKTAKAEVSEAVEAAVDSAKAEDKPQSGKKPK